MPIKSRWTTTIPEVSLPTYLFGSPKGPLPTNPLILDARSPDKHFLSYSTFRLWSQRFAVGLKRAGLQGGDRVLLFSGNTIFFPAVILGTVMAGGIFTGANPTYVARELAFQLSESGAKFLITAEDSLDTALDAAKQIGMDESCIFLFDDGIATHEERGQGRGEVRHWSALLGDAMSARQYEWKELSPAALRDTIVALNFSSGTTGKPKGVEITHYNYVSNACTIEFQGRLDSQYEEKRARERLLCFL
jgi:4-coumarate--CoA ligase